MQNRPIIEAIKNDQIDDLEELMLLVVNKELKIDETDKKGRTALIHAAKKGYDWVVNVLLAHGANINATDEDGKNALRHAVERSHANVVDLLLEHGGVNIDEEDLTFGETALRRAAAQSDNSIAKMLLDHGARSDIFPIPPIDIDVLRQSNPLPSPLPLSKRQPARALCISIESEKLMQDRFNKARELRSFFLAPRQPSNSLSLIPAPETLTQLQILLPQIVRIVEEYLGFTCSSKFTKRPY